MTSSLDQGLRFSLDKATYELLYLPLAPPQRVQIKAAIDIVVSRVADAVAAVLLGLATQGFLMFDGMGLALRGTAAVNLGFIGAWVLVATRLRGEYVRTIQSSIHRHRIASEHAPDVPLDRSAASMLAGKLASQDAADVRYALDWLDAQGMLGLDRQVRQLLSHRETDIRRRALAMLSAARDTSIGRQATDMLRDSDLGVRTEALLYVTRELRVDPIRQLEELGDVEDFSIRAGMAAFLASPGPSQNLDAARLLLETMARSGGEDGIPDRLQAARVLSLVPGLFTDLLVELIGDPHDPVARQAIQATSVVMREEVVAALLAALARPELTGDAADRLSRYGNALVPRLAQCLHDERVPVEIRREVPQVLVRIGTPVALEVLIQGLLQSDVTLRQRVIASLNKLHDVHPDVHIDEHLVELVLAAEIAGHYRSYQVLGPLREHLKDDDPGLDGLRRSMDQELERMFRLMTLLVPGPGVHDAYVGVRSGNPTVRENALEYLDNVLEAGSAPITAAACRQPRHHRGAHRNRQSDCRRPARERRTGDRDAAGERRSVAALVRRLRGGRPSTCTTWSPICRSSRRPTNRRCARPFRRRFIASPVSLRRRRHRLPSGWNRGLDKRGRHASGMTACARLCSVFRTRRSMRIASAGATPAGRRSGNAPRSLYEKPISSSSVCPGPQTGTRWFVDDRLRDVQVCREIAGPRSSTAGRAAGCPRPRRRIW